MTLPRPIDGLAFRIGLLLTLAMIPIGLFALSLNREVAAERQEQAEAGLLALAYQAAASEEAFLRSGFNVASTLAAAVPMVIADPFVCSEMFTAVARSQAEFSFSGYVNRNGILACSSVGSGRDESGNPVFATMRRMPMPRSDIIDDIGAPGSPALALSWPVFDRVGAFDGFVLVSIPNQLTRRSREILSAQRPVDLITFNSDGVILSSEEDIATADQRLPIDRDLAEFVGRSRQSFTARTIAGETRTFAVLPIISNSIYALGSWPANPMASGVDPFLLSPLLFPSLVLMASLGVAFSAVHFLAIRNIEDLKQRMHRFMSTRRFERRRARRAVPREFREIDDTWQTLAETVVRDEAELENIIHVRTVLLKEVHHRVKNNLQLIASIVSMKLRKAKTPEAQAALREVQMRVMSISTVHLALYTTSTVGRVQADELIRTIVGKTIEAAAQPAGTVRVSTLYEPMTLYPDQAVPLSLLVSEAVTNAMKYVGRPHGAEPWVSVRLAREGQDQAVIEVENSGGTPLLPPEQVRGTGLGASLIDAFTRQMRGRVEQASGDGISYRVRVVFPIGAFDHQPTDSGIPLG